MRVSCGGPSGAVRFALSVSVLAALLLVGAGSASAGTVTVCPSGCAFSQIAPAIAAASSGDTIQVAAGTYDGGFTIDKSLQLVGAGAGLTFISRGGPVVMVGVLNASSEPTVSIASVTITGGLNTSSPFPFVARGGGIDVPHAANFAPGATLTISDSVISGNRTAPSAATDSGIPCPRDITITCINGDLPFAAARGGGIATSGALTLSNTIVRDNVCASSVTSDAEGCGIFSLPGSNISLSNSTVTGNVASAVAPNGRFADGGGIFALGTVAIDSSVVTDNSASLGASMPSDVPDGTLAIGGGIHVGDTVPAAKITNTTVSGNSISATNTVGDANAFSGGLHTDVNFTLSKDVITNNTVSVAALAHSGGNAAGDSGAGEWGGTVTNTRVSSNSVSASSVAGDADADAGATIFAGTMTNSVVSDNHVQASSRHGTAIDRGGGLVAGDVITLRNTTVSGNTANASGRAGFGRGGGIFDVDLSPNGPSGGLLTLINSRVTSNVLSGSSAITLQGGGIYATNPVSLTNTVIANNIPDQCFGC